jgi:hypothetical protein
MIQEHQENSELYRVEQDVVQLMTAADQIFSDFHTDKKELLNNIKYLEEVNEKLGLVINSLKSK